jgi:predicted lipoprotein with Yx(FWY)xxD motif
MGEPNPRYGDHGMQSTLRPLFLVLGIVALLAACSTPAASTAPSVAPPSAAAPSEAPSEAPPSEAPPSEAPSAAADATIALATNALGEIIVDAEGKTLYAFTPDTAGESTCYDDCATAWPPLLAADGATPSAGTGLDATKLTTVARTDGTMQVKYGDWPLYYFANDAAAGDTNGQGINNVWYVVDAAGALIGQ